MKIHFSGIGGTAMIGGAYLAKQKGYEIRGSDNPLYPPTSILVKKLSVPIYECYKSSNLDWGPDIVVIGNALSRGNEEVETVLDKRMTYTSLPEWLRYNILQKRKSIVVSGTHGKTTTTSLIAWILKVANMKPGYLIGGYPIDFEFPAELGEENSYFVIEGDEYDTAFFDKRAKFLHYLPQVVVITSLEYDHSDIYNNIHEIEKAFQLLLRTVPSKGLVCLCGDNNAQILKEYCFSQSITYGFSDECLWKTKVEFSADNKQMEQHIYYKDKYLGKVTTSLFGNHNALNILCGVAVTHSLGIPFSVIRDGISSFRGVRRRQEIFFMAQGKTFIDDFAHHPTAIKETLLSFKMKYPDKRIIAVFEPRSNTTVTNIFQNEITDALSLANEVWITPIYREEKIPEEKRLNKIEIVEILNKRGIKANNAKTYDEIFQYLCNNLEGEVIVILMSNGACGHLRENIQNYYSKK
ncbi:MAG TPA: UDP-N-acetylmuramate:L-alanyl-gamma-D-glutamyl-meso-diaminopimelate ligase [Candidatus Hydrogenedens sp.]|nr:UDP-N-acetylmuramate:L-alanyl-gamma-D-glutamyl-meso-diaminopimelate ligase [Candidatus Hydrogenedens sp.]